MNNTYIMNSPYTLQEVTECALKLKVKTTPEEIFNFWESKGWKTKKGIRVQSLVVAVTVANGSINYSKNKDFYKAKERKLAKERRENVAKAIKNARRKSPSLMNGIPTNLTDLNGKHSVNLSL